jgi:hypothetical protein
MEQMALFVVLIERRRFRGLSLRNPVAADGRGTPGTRIARTPEASFMCRCSTGTGVLARTQSAINVDTEVWNK